MHQKSAIKKRQEFTAWSIAVLWFHPIPSRPRWPKAAKAGSRLAVDFKKTIGKPWENDDLHNKNQ